MFNSFAVHSFWKHQSREDAVSNLMLSNLGLKEEALALDGTLTGESKCNNSFTRLVDVIIITVDILHYDSIGQFSVLSVSAFPSCLPPAFNFYTDLRRVFFHVAHQWHVAKHSCSVWLCSQGLAQIGTSCSMFLLFFLHATKFHLQKLT